MKDKKNIPYVKQDVNTADIETFLETVTVAGKRY